MDFLGVPKNADGLDYDDLKQLRKGTLTHKRYEKVLLGVIEGVAGAFIGIKEARELLKSVVAQKSSGPVKKIHWVEYHGLLVPVPEHFPPQQSVNWKKNPDGSIANLAELVMHDGLEFLLRHDYFLQKVGQSKSPQKPALAYWLRTFVIPFLAMNLFEYVRADSNFERGLPAGRFWYLPIINAPSRIAKGLGDKYPINSLLEWWQDLLGVKLESVAHRLFHPDDPHGLSDKQAGRGGFDDEHRQVRELLKEYRPPNLKTIDHWCSQAWDYEGAFEDDATLDLSARWEKCRAFLKRKGLDKHQSDWLDGLSEDQKAEMKEQYRGELLELEILPFKETAFTAFFKSSDPLAQGLPVEEFINRVAERYAKPSNDQLRARLIVASAFQRAYAKAKEEFGDVGAAELVRWYERVYCFLVRLHNQAGQFANPELQAIRILLNQKDHDPMLKYSCEWIFDEGLFKQLPFDYVTIMLQLVSPKKK